MCDINKYLETQRALAQQKSKINKKILASQKSLEVAERISSKQDIAKNGKRVDNSDAKLMKRKKSSTCTDKASDGESDYLPSSDDEDESNVSPFSLKSRSKVTQKKITDDGDVDSYNIRVKNWRDQLTAALAGTAPDFPQTADVQYVINGKKDVDLTHELQNGLQVPNFIWKQLYKYQRIGVKWLWELHQVESGGLLGDEMGLGKTVQIIAFLASLSKTETGSWNGLGPSIIVSPATVIYQWVSHFHYWCPFLRVAVLHHSGSYIGNHNKLVKDMHASHGILLITYAGIAKYYKDLMCRKWHYIILDEGHKIRNPEAQVSKHIKKFQTPHKLLITGSPMQNSLQELWSLFDFMRPGLLGTHAAFMEHFAAPITQGGYANATEFQEATALEIAKALKTIITPYMLRRTKAEVQEFIKLPEKNEQVLFCALSKEQRDLYMGYLTSGTVRSILDKESSFGNPFRARILVALYTLRKICNHPDLYLYEAQNEDEEIMESTFGHWKRSGKMIVVQSLLKIWQKQGHRSLIFTQSRAMLCLLEHHLQKYDYKYLKMDGTVSVAQRQHLIKNFNENSEYLVFLATTRVGGLGINLTGADRVIIYDPDWNPATDNQAKERAWRIGQKRDVTVYRLLSAGTIEEKIYQRQLFKHFLSNKVLIDPNQKNVLTTSTLQGLFTLDDLNSDGDTETASLFKHTKVSVNEKKPKELHCKDICHDKIANTSKTKLEAMKRRAREISKKIVKDNSKNKLDEDPRDKYKKKREIMLNPPIVEEPEINVVNDVVTDTPFESVLSELDIVNLHAKKDYEENLIKEIVKSQEQESSKSSSDDSSQVSKTTNDVYIKNSESEPSNPNFIDKKINNSKEIRKLKRKSSTSYDLEELDNVVAVKKVKKKKSKKHKDKEHKKDDDYVLTKLFAKANVKNALQHDVVVGLAEKEKRHRMKEEATRKARHAVKAIKFSYK